MQASPEITWPCITPRQSHAVIAPLTTAATATKTHPGSASTALRNSSPALGMSSPATTAAAIAARAFGSSDSCTSVFSASQENAAHAASITAPAARSIHSRLMGCLAAMAVRIPRAAGSRRGCLAAPDGP